MAEQSDRPTARRAGEGPSDGDLLRRFVEGDREALGQLVRRYEQPLFGYLVRMLGDASAAEDAFQQVCLRLVRGAGSYDPARPVRPWLYTIATNVCRRQGSRAARHRALRLDPGGGEEQPEVLGGLIADTASPPESAERHELAELVRQAVETLTDHQREAFVLCHYQGLTYGEIARVVGRPLGTVKSDMFYALRALRSKLERYRR